MGVRDSFSNFDFYLLGHLRSLYFPTKNPRIPTPANRQKYCNVSMIIWDVFMSFL